MAKPYHEYVNLVRDINQKRMVQESQASTFGGETGHGPFGTINKDGSRKDFTGDKEKKRDPKSGYSDIDFYAGQIDDKEKKMYSGEEKADRKPDYEIQDEEQDIDKYENMKPGSPIYTSKAGANAQTEDQKKKSWKKNLKKNDLVDENDNDADEEKNEEKD
jgi:hypothetical protein